MTLLPRLVVVMLGVYLVALGVAALSRPALTKRFLSAFASSAPAHYLEQALRLVAGASLLIAAPAMHFAQVFDIFGWVLIGTSAGLLLLPWRWHHRFAQWATPLVLRHMTIFAVGSLALGTFVLYGIAAAGLL